MSISVPAGGSPWRILSSQTSTPVPSSVCLSLSACEGESKQTGLTVTQLSLEGQRAERKEASRSKLSSLRLSACLFLNRPQGSQSELRSQAVPSLAD